MNLEYVYKWMKENLKLSDKIINLLEYFFLFF